MLGLTLGGSPEGVGRGVLLRDGRRVLQAGAYTRPPLVST